MGATERQSLFRQGAGRKQHLAPTADDRDIALVSARHIAVEGRVFVMSVCMVLRKASYPDDFELRQELATIADEFLMEGGSAIIGPEGEFMAGPLWKAEGILYADLDMNRIVEERRLFDVTGHYARPDVLSLRFDASRRDVAEILGGVDVRPRT